MKKLICLLLTAIILTFPLSAFAALKPLSIYVDGEKIDFETISLLDRSLIPMRSVFEQLGCTVEYTEAEGIKKVTALRGKDTIEFIIGENAMSINNDVIPLEMAPLIKNHLTFVPYDAVTKALGASVEWDKSETKLYIFSCPGQYIILNEHINKEIISKNGTLLAEINVTYPRIENDTNDGFTDYDDYFIDYINTEYKTEAENFVSEVETLVSPYLTAQPSSDTRSMTFNLSYNLTFNRMNMISITNEYYYDTLGAHPITERNSRSFQMALNKELSLSDVFDAEQEFVNKTVCDNFLSYFKNAYSENDMEYTLEDALILEEEVENVQFTLNDDSVTLYFNPYQVAPYSFGRPSVTIPYDNGEGVIKLDLSKGKQESLTFSLSSNPTTGYGWTFEHSDNLHIKDEYIPNDNPDGMIGVGGRHYFTVSGIDAGSGIIKAYYHRSWEGTDNAQTKTYRFYVDENLTVTLIEEK